MIGLTSLTEISSALAGVPDAETQFFNRLRQGLSPRASRKADSMPSGSGMREPCRAGRARSSCTSPTLPAGADPQQSHENRPAHGSAPPPRPAVPRLVLAVGQEDALTDRVGGWASTGTSPRQALRHGGARVRAQRVTARTACDVAALDGLRGRHTTRAEELNCTHEEVGSLVGGADRRSITSGETAVDRRASPAASAIAAISSSTSEPTSSWVHSTPRPAWCPPTAVPSRPRRHRRSWRWTRCARTAAPPCRRPGAARSLFRRPTPTRSGQCVFLTDGKNESEEPRDVAGLKAPVRGPVLVRTAGGSAPAWQVGEVAGDRARLLGKASSSPTGRHRVGLSATRWRRPCRSR